MMLAVHAVIVLAVVAWSVAVLALVAVAGVGVARWALGRPA